MDVWYADMTSALSGGDWTNVVIFWRIRSVPPSSPSTTPLDVHCMCLVIYLLVSSCMLAPEAAFLSADEHSMKMFIWKQIPINKLICKRFDNLTSFKNDIAMRKTAKRTNAYFVIVCSMDEHAVSFPCLKDVTVGQGSSMQLCAISAK